MIVRSYDPKDAEALTELFCRSVGELGLRDYSAGQVKAWLTRAPNVERMHELNTDGRTVLVAVNDEDQPLGFGHLEADGHIDFFYCAPEAAGKGVGSVMYDALEVVARKAGLARLYVEASEAARRLFLRKSFTVTVKRDFEIAGVAIHNYAMEKMLSRVPGEAVRPRPARGSGRVQKR